MRGHTLLLCVSLLAGCTELLPGGDLPMESDASVAVDAGTRDAGEGIDAGVDPDAGSVDGGGDAGVDSDASVDAGRDSGTDADAGPEGDGGTDAGTDAGPPDCGPTLDGPAHGALVSSGVLGHDGAGLLSTGTVTDLEPQAPGSPFAATTVRAEMVLGPADLWIAKTRADTSMPGGSALALYRAPLDDPSALVDSALLLTGVSRATSDVTLAVIGDRLHGVSVSPTGMRLLEVSLAGAPSIVRESDLTVPSPFAGAELAPRATAYYQGGAQPLARAFAMFDPLGVETGALYSSVMVATPWSLDTRMGVRLGTSTGSWILTSTPDGNALYRAGSPGTAPVPLAGDGGPRPAIALRSASASDESYLAVVSEENRLRVSTLACNATTCAVTDLPSISVGGPGARASSLDAAVLPGGYVIAGVMTGAGVRAHLRLWFLDAAGARVGGGLSGGYELVTATDIDPAATTLADTRVRVLQRGSDIVIVATATVQTGGVTVTWAGGIRGCNAP